MPRYIISLQLAETRLSVTDQGEATLLEIMHGLNLPVRKACRNGACGVCRCHLQSGDISYRQRQPFGLWDKDIAAGFILPCIAYARSDLALDELTLEAEKKARSR